MMCASCTEGLKRAGCLLSVLLFCSCSVITNAVPNLVESDHANIGLEGGRQFMQAAYFQPSNENSVERSVTIERPVQSVYEFYRDFKNLPRFLGDVMNIEQTGPATSRWTIQGPFRIQAHWTIKVTEERTNESIRYETVSSPTLKTRWEI